MGPSIQLVQKERLRFWPFTRNHTPLEVRFEAGPAICDYLAVWSENYVE